MSAANLEPYATLGVTRGASYRQVREAYRRLAKRYHPDLHPTNETDDRMRRINQAWEILSNPTLRARYEMESTRAATASAGHWAAGRRTTPVARPSTTWGPRPPYPRNGSTYVDEGGPRWPWVLLAVVLGPLVVVAALVGILPFPLFGIALVVLARGLIGRFGEGR